MKLSAYMHLFANLACNFLYLNCRLVIFIVSKKIFHFTAFYANIMSYRAVSFDDFVEYFFFFEGNHGQNGRKNW